LQIWSCIQCYPWSRPRILLNCHSRYLHSFDCIFRQLFLGILRSCPCCFRYVSQFTPVSSYWRIWTYQWQCWRYCWNVLIVKVRQRKNWCSWCRWKHYRCCWKRIRYWISCFGLFGPLRRFLTQCWTLIQYLDLYDRALNLCRSSYRSYVALPLFCLHHQISWSRCSRYGRLSPKTNQTKPRHFERYSRSWLQSLHQYLNKSCSLWDDCPRNSCKFYFI